jgi:hypothetical protein
LQVSDFRESSRLRGIWFGTRGSEVQILSPRPLFSIVYSHLIPIRKSVKGGVKGVHGAE